MTERVRVPVSTHVSTVTDRTGRVTVRDTASVLERPGGRSFARVEGGSVSLPASAELDGAVRVDIGGGTPAWIATSDIVSGRAAAGRIVTVLDAMPPSIDVEGTTLVTTSETLSLRGIARDDTVVRDVYIYVGMRKVFYSSNRRSATPREAHFEATVPLRPGTNYVVIFARENDDSISRRSFVVRRDAPDGSLMETPPISDEWFHFGIDEAPEE